MFYCGTKQKTLSCASCFPIYLIVSFVIILQGFQQDFLDLTKLFLRQFLKISSQLSINYIASRPAFIKKTIFVKPEDLIIIVWNSGKLTWIWLSPNPSNRVWFGVQNIFLFSIEWFEKFYPSILKKWKTARFCKTEYLSVELYLIYSLTRPYPS